MLKLFKSIISDCNGQHKNNEQAFKNKDSNKVN